MEQTLTQDEMVGVKLRSAVFHKLYKITMVNSFPHEDTTDKDQGR